MRCYLVKAPDACVYAGTNAAAREARRQLVEELGCKKSEVTIEQVDVPTAKDDLIGYLNRLLEK